MKFSYMTLSKKSLNILTFASIHSCVQGHHQRKSLDPEIHPFCVQLVMRKSNMFINWIIHSSFNKINKSINCTPDVKQTTAPIVVISCLNCYSVAVLFYALCLFVTYSLLNTAILENSQVTKKYITFGGFCLRV